MKSVIEWETYLYTGFNFNVLIHSFDSNLEFTNRISNNRNKTNIHPHVIRQYWAAYQQYYYTTTEQYY